MSDGMHGHPEDRPRGEAPPVEAMPGEALSGDEPPERTRDVSVSERTGRRVVSLLFLATGVTAAAAAAVIPVLLGGNGGQVLEQQEGAVLAGLVAGTVALLWFAVRLCLLSPGERLAADIHLLAARGSSGGRVDDEAYPDLYPLPEAVNALALRLTAARRDIDRAVAEANERASEQSGRLSTILHDLNEGVLVCNLRHQVVLDNPAALRLLAADGDSGNGPGSDSGHGRNLFSLMLADPVRHTLERLTRHGGSDSLQADKVAAARFIGGTPDGRILLDGRMSLILKDEAASYGGGPVMAAGRIVTGYVLTFIDATKELAALGRRDALLRATTEDLRGPLANLRAVMETLDACPDLEREARTRLEEAMSRECETLTDRLDQISDQYRTTIAGNWPMTDLRSQTVIDLVRHRVAAHRSVTITPGGIPCRLHGDSFSLVMLLDHLVGRVGATTGATAFELAASAAARWTYLDLIWSGLPVPSATIDAWKAEPLPAALGGLTVGGVLRHHRSDLWSETCTEGKARLRLPLPPAQDPSQEPAGAASRPGLRSVFGDFSPLRQPLPEGEPASRRLDDLNFVAFDLATTGLKPEDGDEIVAIAAVRIANHRILTDETFLALVNPGRPVPPEATRWHGITDQQLQDRPNIATVLPQFRSFADDAVLIGHHAAFDLRFLRRKERTSGVRFDNPVLDTTLLSLSLHGEGADHSLDGIARRLGISAIDRHTALGDSLTTAAVLLAMLEPLRERGFETLGDILRETNRLADLSPAKEPPP